MSDLLKQLNRAGKMLAQAVEQAANHAEEQILALIAEEVAKRGYDEDKLDELFDFGRQELPTNPEEGLLINEVFVIGEKETKQVMKAYRLEVTYRPEGINSDKALVMKVRGRVEEVTDSFFYPEDDDCIFH